MIPDPAHRQTGHAVVLDALSGLPGTVRRTGGGKVHAALGPRLTLSVREAAEVLGISAELVYEQAKRDELPSVRVGRRVRVPVRPLLNLVGMSWEDWLAAELASPR